MVARGELADAAVLGLLARVGHGDPALDVALLDDVEQVAYVACAHNDLSLAVPVRLEPVEERKFFVVVQVFEDLDALEEAELGGAPLQHGLDHDLLKDTPVEDPDLALGTRPDGRRALVVVEQRDFAKAVSLDEYFVALRLLALAVLWAGGASRGRDDDVAFAALQYEVLGAITALRDDVVALREGLRVHRVDDRLQSLLLQTLRQEGLLEGH